MTLTGPGFAARVGGPDINKYDVINNYLFPFPIYFVCALVGGMSDDASYVYLITSETSM